METLAATFQVPAWIRSGLTSGSYERVGGVIREAGSKQVVAWLRETSPWPNTQVPIDSLGSLLQLGVSANVLTLGITAVGFAAIAQRLSDLEKRLKQSEALLQRLNRRVDLGIYANFRAALDLATNAFTLSKAENRKGMAIQAINRFLEAQHIYSDLADQKLEARSSIADEYLLTLMLAHVAEARCYLELEEPEAALRRLQDVAKPIRQQGERYVRMLLTSNPAAYLHSAYQEIISLQRLTRVYQWLYPQMDEVSVFEMLRKFIFRLDRDQGLESNYAWVNSLPPAIVDSSEVQGGLFGNRQGLRAEAWRRLPKVIEDMEAMIEAQRRFAGYGLEIQILVEQDIPFHVWAAIPPPTDAPVADSWVLLPPTQAGRG